MKDFFYGGIHKKRGSSSWMDEYEDELAIKKAKEFSKGMTMDKIKARLAEMDEQEAKALMNDDDIIVHILQPKEHIMGLVRKYFPQYEHGTPAFDAKVEQIVKNNKIKNRHTVLIGQRIEIPITKAERDTIQAFEHYETKNKSKETPISFNNLFHYVQKGDNLDNIIQRYFPYLEVGSPDYQEKEIEFIQRHNLKDKTDIKIGQQLVVVVNTKERQKADEYYKKNKMNPNPYLGNVGDMLRDDLLERDRVNTVSKQHNFDLQALLINRMTEEEVKKQLFFNKSKYKHLVSHGMPGMSITGESYLPSNNNSQDNQLRNNEIENLPLSGTELAFLAICYSGQQGESNTTQDNKAIARSFMNAGVNQTISTDWILNSPFSAVFSAKFYDNLSIYKDDVSKALWKTQLEFLQKGEKLKNWAIYKHLDKKYNKKEYTLSKHKSDEGRAASAYNISFDSSNLILLQAKLAKQEAIVDIYSNNYQYFAFIITPTKYTEIELSDIETIQRYAAYSNNIISFERSPQSKSYQDFYNIIWGKIDVFLQNHNVSKIYLSTENAYDNIKIEAIFDNNTNSYILQKYHIQWLF